MDVVLLVPLLLGVVSEIYELLAEDGHNSDCKTSPSPPTDKEEGCTCDVKSPDSIWSGCSLLTNSKKYPNGGGSFYCDTRHPPHQQLHSVLSLGLLPAS